jgi:hypothetical protein
MTSGSVVRAAANERRPIFLLAPPRSCSTVAIALLSGHPEIFGFPEMLIFTASTVGELLTEAERKPYLDSGYVCRRQTGILRAVAELREHSQRPVSIARAGDWLARRAKWSTTRLLDHLLDLAQPQVGLEKSPDTVASKECLARCLACYPAARFIHLTRHPVATQTSMVAHLRAGLVGDERKRIIEAASSWYLGHYRIVQALREMTTDQWMRIRAEDLLGDPHGCLAAILNWLDLKRDPATLTSMLHTEDWVFAGTGQGHNLFGGDSKFMFSPQLRPIPDPGPVAFDPAWELPVEMVRRMTILARYLRYE